MGSFRRLLEAHATKGDKLSLELFTPDRRDLPDEELVENTYVQIKGSPASLRFLGELLIQFAHGDQGCTFDLHPEAAGSSHFVVGSKLGIYLRMDPYPVDGQDAARDDS